MDNNTSSTTARRPIVRVIESLQNAENHVSFESLEELSRVQGLLMDAGLGTYARRIENLRTNLLVAAAEMNDIHEQIVGIARAEAKMKARPEGA